jgi:hypothetical protein
MTIWALLGVEIFRRNTEHVVTLNANAMKSRLSRRRSLMFWSGSLGLRGFCAHGEILAHHSGNSTVWVWASLGARTMEDVGCRRGGKPALTKEFTES